MQYILKLENFIRLWEIQNFKINLSETNSKEIAPQSVLSGTSDNQNRPRHNNQPPPERATRLPVSRIKTIMRFDPDVNIISQEAGYLVTKATEAFVEAFALAAHQSTLTQKRKTLQKKDIDTAIMATDRLCFLDGIDLGPTDK